MTSHAHLLGRLDEAALTLAEYVHTDASRAAVSLIDSLLAMYLQDLCDVSVDRLQRVQGYVAQLKELRGLMTATVKTNGRL